MGMVSTSCDGPPAASGPDPGRVTGPRGWLFVAEKADTRRPADWAAAGGGAARNFRSAGREPPAGARAPSFRSSRGQYGRRGEATEEEVMRS